MINRFIRLIRRMRGQKLQLCFDLQRFGEGGGAGAGGAGGDGGAAGAEGAAPGEAGEAAAAKGGKAAEDLSKVVYGKQDQQPEAEEPAKPEKEEAAQQQPAKKASLGELLKNDPDYQHELDQMFNRRFAKERSKSEELNKELAKIRPVLNMFAAKYGIEAGNTDALVEAVNDDAELIEQQAMDAGMEPDAYREFQKLKAENEAFRQEKANREREAQIQEDLQKWNRQADDARLIYPTLDLRAEAQNGEFVNMLRAGVDVKTAYEVIHMQEIQTGLIQRAAAEATQKTVASIAAKANRPRENGASRPQAATVKSDYTKLTIKDFDEIDRRLRRGDIIRY